MLRIYNCCTYFTHSVTVSDTFQMDFIWFNPNPRRNFKQMKKYLFSVYFLTQSCLNVFLGCCIAFSIEFGNRSVCICRYITQKYAPDLNFHKDQNSKFPYLQICQKSIYLPQMYVIVQIQQHIYHKDIVNICKTKKETLICKNTGADWGPSYIFFGGKSEKRKKQKIAKRPNWK